MQKRSLVATEPVERELDHISGQFHLVTVASDSLLLPEKKLQSSFLQGRVWRDTGQGLHLGRL